MIVVVKTDNVKVLDDSEGWIITGMSDKIEMKGGVPPYPRSVTLNNFGPSRLCPFHWRVLPRINPTESSRSSPCLISIRRSNLRSMIWMDPFQVN